MAGAYLQIYPQDSYTYTTNVTLNNVAQDLTGSTIWFTSFQTGFDNANTAAIFSVNSVNGANTVANISVSNGVGISTNSVVTVNFSPAFTNSLSLVNSAAWSLVAKTSAGAVYTLDKGRLAVSDRPSVNFL